MLVYTTSLVRFLYNSLMSLYSCLPSSPDLFRPGQAKAKPSDAKDLFWVAQGQDGAPVSWLLLWPVSTLWLPLDRRFRSLEIAAPIAVIARPLSWGTASVLKDRLGSELR